MTEILVDPPSIHGIRQRCPALLQLAPGRPEVPRQRGRRRALRGRQRLHVQDRGRDDRHHVRQQPGRRHRQRSPTRSAYVDQQHLDRRSATSRSRSPSRPSRSPLRRRRPSPSRSPWRPTAWRQLIGTVVPGSTRSAAGSPATRPGSRAPPGRARAKRNAVEQVSGFTTAATNKANTAAREPGQLHPQADRLGDRRRRLVPAQPGRPASGVNHGLRHRPSGRQLSTRSSDPPRSGDHGLRRHRPRPRSTRGVQGAQRP